MGWKPKKERALTLEEALDLARKELAPLWFNGPPLLSPVIQEGGRYTAHPIEEDFAAKSWLLMFFDPYSFGGEYAFQLAREWRRRYEDNDIEFLMVLHSAHPALFTPRVMQQLILQQKIPHSIMLDAQADAIGALSASFGASTLPAVALFADRKLQFGFQGAGWYDSVEKALQSYIRSKDPGCPFYPPLDHSGISRSDVARVDFGGRFGAVNLATSKLVLTGQWTREAERVVTKDPQARITLTCPGSRLAVIAQAVLHEKVCRLAMDVNGRPPGEKVLTPAAHADEDGSSFLRIDPPAVYHILHDLPLADRAITLRFPNADRCPIGIYSLLYGN